MFMAMNLDNTGRVLSVSLPAIRADKRALVFLSPEMNVSSFWIRILSDSKLKCFLSFRIKVQLSEFSLEAPKGKTLDQRRLFSPTTENYRPLEDNCVHNGSGTLRAGVCFLNACTFSSP